MYSVLFDRLGLAFWDECYIRELCFESALIIVYSEFLAHLLVKLISHFCCLQDGDGYDTVVAESIDDHVLVIRDRRRYRRLYRRRLTVSYSSIRRCSCSAFVVVAVAVAGVTITTSTTTLRVAVGLNSGVAIRAFEK